jgi:hypothetical protein
MKISTHKFNFTSKTETSVKEVGPFSKEIKNFNQNIKLSRLISYTLLVVHGANQISSHISSFKLTEIRGMLSKMYVVDELTDKLRVPFMYLWKV